MEASQKRVTKLKDQWDAMIEKDRKERGEEEEEGDSVPMSIMDCEEVKRTCMLSNVNSLPIKLKVTQKKGRGEDEDEEGENDT